MSSWTVPRRYSEFYELHKTLRRQFADVKNIAFPKKSNPIGVLVKPTRGGFVESRMASLEKYMQVDNLYGLLTVGVVARSGGTRVS